MHPRTTLPLLLVFLHSGCATNPARNLEPNGVDVRVSTVDPVGLFRGEEKLDEQDFYQLNGDTESADAVRSSRGTGAAMQVGGASLVTVGVAAMAFGFLNGLLADGGLLGEKGLYPAGTIGGLTGYLIAGAGGLAVFGGGTLFVSGGNKVRGEPPVFDLVHAQASIERGRYGANGLTPEHVSALALVPTSGQATYCPLSGASVEPLIAKDKDGKDIAIHQHLDWVTVSSTPGGVVTAADVATGVDSFVSDEDVSVDGTFSREAATQAAPKRHLVASPLARSLASYGQPVTLTARVNATGVTTALTLTPDHDCFQDVSLSGDRGTRGDPGDPGRSASSSTSASPGGNGGTGGDGSMGPDVEVEAAWVRDPSGRRLALVAWQSGQSGGATLVGAKGNLHFNANGGAGGRGGSGGRGGRGVDGNSKRCPSDGASGGSGGSGGRGGTGGRVRLAFADPSLSAVVRATVQGGSGGEGGSAGSGGSGGSSSKGCSSARSGGSGTRGTNGPPGQDGTVTRKSTTTSQLTLVNQAFASLKGFTFDGAKDAPVASEEDDDSAPSPAPAPSKRKGKKR